MPVIVATGERKNAAPMSGPLNDASKSAHSIGPGVHRPFRSRISPFAPSGESMNKVDLSAVWAPTVLGKDRIDQRRWAYAVAAPFDMPADMPGLVGTKVQLDGSIFEIGGFVPRMPPLPIKEGEAIELLVRAAGIPSM